MLHVYPLNDIDTHDTTNNGNTCKCNPEVIIKSDCEIIVVHNSYDGREEFELY